MEAAAFVTLYLCASRATNGNCVNLLRGASRSRTRHLPACLLVRLLFATHVVYVADAALITPNPITVHSLHRHTHPAQPHSGTRTPHHAAPATSPPPPPPLTSHITAFTTILSHHNHHKLPVITITTSQPHHHHNHHHIPAPSTHTLSPHTQKSPRPLHKQTLKAILSGRVSVGSDRHLLYTTASTFFLERSSGTPN